jgi:hypothetical protein
MSSCVFFQVDIHLSMYSSCTFGSSRLYVVKSMKDVNSSRSS